MINYTKHFIDKKDINAVTQVLQSENITQGKKVLEFEKSLNKYFGSKNSVVVSNATIALYLLAKKLKWGKNDYIICSPISFLSASNAILISGAKPVFVDINYYSGNIDVNKIEKKILELNKKKKKIKAIIVVDFGGFPADWRKLKLLGKKYKLTLINDNCHAIGASYENSKKYAVKFADFVIQSYHAAKNITTGEGGSILSNNKKIIDEIKHLRTHGVKKGVSKFPWYYEMHDLSYNARITDFQCALGISQLKKLDKFIKKRKKIADLYFNKLKDIKYVELPIKSPLKKSAYHLFPLKIDFSKFKITKEKLFKIMKSKYQINLQVHYIPIFDQPYYKKKLKIKRLDFKNSVKFYNVVISIPIYYSLTLKKANEVINSLIKVLKIYAK